MKKILGYILAIVGLVGVAIYMMPELQSVSGIPEDFIGLPLIIVSLVLVLIGIFILMKSKGNSKALEEVPIYKGKQVVGYRRH